MNKKFSRIGNDLLCFILGSVFGYFYKKKKVQGCKGGEKDKKVRQLFDNWLVLAERGIKLEEYFHKKNIHKVAVYGYADIGNHLVVQLGNTDIEVRYIIDRRPCSPAGEIKWYRPTDRLPAVDAVIITPVWEYDQIKDALQHEVSGQIISIEDIIYELL